MAMRIAVLVCMATMSNLIAGPIAARGCCVGNVSEGTVAKALKWLADHQQPDGSWASPPEQAKPDAQAAPISPTHSTGIVLLSLLGAGITHHEGPYQKEVRAGLDYLKAQMAERDDLGDLRGSGDMVAHGAAALALAEAYSMTQDRELIVAAQLAVRFSERSQNRETGGWGAQPQDRDDMHVAGWQWLTRRSAKESFVLTLDEARERSIKYLDAQRASDEEELFGRFMPAQDVRATAIGLVGRIALRDVRDNAHWHAAARWAAVADFAEHDIEQNFWVAQVAHQSGGETWQMYNAKLRGAIVARQINDDALRGSWFDEHDANAAHGRVWQTAVSTMCLEVYYRHLPVYGDYLLKAREERAEAVAEDPFGEPAGNGEATDVDDLFGEPSDDLFE